MRKYHIIKTVQYVKPWEHKDFTLIEGELPEEQEGWSHIVCDTFECQTPEYADHRFKDFTGQVQKATKTLYQLWWWDENSREPQLILQSESEIDCIGKGWIQALKTWDEFPEEIDFGTDPRQIGGPQATYYWRSTYASSFLYVSEGSYLCEGD
jgi:hypothetical protein